MGEKLDYIFNKMIPKKLLAWIVATVLVFMGILPAEYWFYITIGYMAVNGIQKFVKPK